ncbi:hypothetical protein [Klebsiella pneumoniae]|uniref:hypothetical protein n=1 Tax=Klebsiella pneumoniae TaxID=573 RepID=UPI003D7C6580
MSRWFYCVEIYKNGQFEGKQSGIFPQEEDEALAELSDHNNPSIVFNSISYMFSAFNEDLSKSFVITAFNKV